MANSMQKEYLINGLKQLASRIKNEIEDSLSRNIIEPEEETHFRWKVDTFKYTDEGVTDYSASGEYVDRKSWYRAHIKLQESIKKYEEYAAVLEISKARGHDGVVQNIDSFVGKLVTHRLYQSRLDETDIDTYISVFLKDLDEKPLKYGAYVELDGIVMRPESIELRIGYTDIVLRQTKIQDMEKEFPVYAFMRPRGPTPSAILDIEFLSRDGREIQTKVMQAIAILRLFKVGSVKYISYSMRSESITDMTAGGTITAGQSEMALEKSLITQQDIPRLKSFWQSVSKALPQSFYEFGETRIDHLLVAYRRYCDALLQNGVLERRIANAVMGLESLFLKGTEAQELTYRLGIRTAKIFSILGYDPYKLKGVVKDGYKIRSLFVHGSHLSYKEKRKITTKYGDPRGFLLLLLDYLRISIIVTTFARKEKEEFLDMIDDSFVDKDKDSQLNNLLTTARDITAEA